MCWGKTNYPRCYWTGGLPAKRNNKLQKTKILQTRSLISSEKLSSILALKIKFIKYSSLSDNFLKSPILRVLSRSSKMLRQTMLKTKSQNPNLKIKLRSKTSLLNNNNNLSNNNNNQVLRFNNSLLSSSSNNNLPYKQKKIRHSCQQTIQPVNNSNKQLTF